MADDVIITIRADNGDVIRAFRDVDGRLRDLRGRFITEGTVMTGSMNRLSASIGGVKGSLIPLATAAVPLGAALAPIAVKAGAAGLAVAAFGAAVAGQVSHLSEASEAQDKYSAAVAQYGRGSKQAAEAQRALASSLASMPQATARAAVGLSTLKTEAKGWSDELAGFTMTPVEKSFTLLGQALPKLTPMVQGASSQLDRLVTVAGGAMTTPGFDELSDKISTFSNNALKDAVDGIIHFSRALSEGDAGGPVKAFMEYAEQNGPALRETLSSVSDAVSTLVEASANAGPGMLTLVNAAAQLVASLPPELVTVLMQVAVGLKVLSLAGAGAAAAAAGVQALGVRIAALNATSAAAGGGVAGLRAAFMSLGVAARASVVVAGIAAVAVAFGELGQLGRQAPPDIDKLTTSLGQLGRTGKVSGEAARLFGKDLDGLFDSVRNITDPTTTDKIQQGLVKVFSLGLADSTPHSEAEDRLKGIDAGLTNLVRGGKADVAAAAFKRLSAEYVDGGGKARDFKSSMDGYASVLADVALEQQLTADSMGFFGEAALATSAKLEAQQRSADGLRASILALNDVNRSAYEAQIGFEASLDSLTESFKEHGSTLNLDTEAGRANGQAMADAAKAQGELIATGLAAGESLGSMTKKSNELRASMLTLATEAFDGNKAKATEYVNTLLGAPSEIKTLVKLEREEAISGLEEVRAAVQATPGSKEVTVSTLNGAAIKALEAVGLKTRTLPDGRTAVFTANGQALGSISSVSSALNRLDGKTANTYTTNSVTTFYTYKGKSIAGVSAGRMADGGRVPGYAGGGDVQLAPDGLLSGPGTGRSDDILAVFASGAVGRVSDTEFVVNARETKKHLPLLEAINDGKLPKFASGGLTSGQVKGLYSSKDMSGLTSTLADVRARIKDKTGGATETRLLRTLDSVGKKLITYEKALVPVNKALDAAKTKLTDLKTAAASAASSVKSGLLGEANITKAAGAEDSRVTINTILSRMRGSASNAKEFDSALKTLKGRGLSSTLLQQVAEAGVDGGGLETAQALMGASSGQLQNLNSLQGQLTASATSAGKTTADAVYASAIRAQTVAVTNLTRSQDKLENAMAKLASALDKTVGRAIGKKASGGIVGAAASGGMRGGLTWVGEHEAELLELPSGSRVWSGPDSRRKAREMAAPWASMLNSPRRSSAGGGGGGGARPIIVHQTITLDGKVVARQILDPLREEIHHLGGNVQSALGKG
jgi:hypothetical protein